MQHSWRWLGGLRSNAGPDRAAPQLTAEQPTSFHQSESCSCLITPDNLKTLTTPTKVRAFSPNLLSYILLYFRYFSFSRPFSHVRYFSDLKQQPVCLRHTLMSSSTTTLTRTRPCGRDTVVSGSGTFWNPNFHNIQTTNIKDFLVKSFRQKGPVKESIKP